MTIIKRAGIKKLARAAVVVATLPGAASPEPQENPWFGTWKLRAQDDGGKPETLVYSDGGHGAMRMESIEAQSVIIARLDGQPAADVGPVAHTGTALAVTATSSTSYAWIFLVDGKPLVEGVNILAPDRRSFRETSWRVGKPDVKITLTYERR